MNGFEERVINEIGNMPNIAFWTRNIEKKGFRINGFVNHYPDFIIQTKSGKTVLLETKGDHLDAEQKIRLGGLWASKAGNNYRYFMVYERRTVDNAYKLEDFLNIIKTFNGQPTRYRDRERMWIMRGTRFLLMIPG
jgi:type III restriction enzyme